MDKSIYEVEITKRYFAAKTYCVKASDETGACVFAEEMSHNDDFACDLQFEDIDSEVIATYNPVAEELKSLLAGKNVSEPLKEMVRKVAVQIASDVNNKGVMKQVEFLSQYLAEAQILKELKEPSK